MGLKISQITTEETSALSDTDVFEGEETGGTSFKVLFSVFKSTLRTYFDSLTTTLTNKTLTTPTIGSFTNAAHNHQNAAGGATLAEAALALTDLTTNDVVSTKHGFAPKSPADAAKFLNGAATPAFALVTGSDLSLSDVTTNNVTSTKHGFAPRSIANAATFLNGATTPSYEYPPPLCITAGAWNALSPADSTAYYFGIPNIYAASSTANLFPITIPAPGGTIFRIDVNFVVLTALGSSETFTTAFRLNNTTDTTISASCKMDALQQTFSNSGLSIVVAAGDTFEIKFTCPAWVTNPTGVRCTALVYMK